MKRPLPGGFVLTGNLEVMSEMQQTGRRDCGDSLDGSNHRDRRRCSEPSLQPPNVRV
jgi:hypothetical protein